MNMRLFLFLLLMSAVVSAQTLPVLDQTPTRLHWYRLKTPHFRVLYPEGLDTTAQQAAQRFEALYEPVSASLSRRPRPISVLLQNQTTISNGFVTLFPRRSEFFAVTPQDPGLLGTNNWLDLLTVHEYRHVVQNDKALQGYGRVLYSLLGNTGLQFPLLTVPDWFAEGDAVSTETLLSSSGRGRIPNFDVGMRSNLLAGRQYAYQKAVGGSYRDNVPNHYVLGYFLTTYGKQTYGPDVWSRVLNRNYRRFPWPFAFSASIQNETGLRVEDLYRKTMDDLTETWRKQQSNLTITPAAMFPVRVEQERGRKPVFTNYQYPQFLTDSTVLCVKSGLGDTPRLVILDKNGQEKQVYVQGFTNDPGMLSATPTKACWIEFGFDPRWGQRDYSNIRLLDLRTGKRILLPNYGAGHRARYTAAALSPDNARIVVVDNTDGNKTQLVVLDARTGNIQSRLSNPDNEFYQHPRWQADNRTLIAVVLKNGKKTIQRIDSKENRRSDVLPRTNENLSNPQPWGNYILYNSPRSGIDNIYAVDTRTKAIFQVTSRSLAAYHAAVSPSGHRLAFDDFSADGYRVADMALDPASWKPVVAGSPDVSLTQAARYFGSGRDGSLIKQEPGAAEARLILQDSVSSPRRYLPQRYRRLANAINVYSWGPIVGSTGQELSVGFNSQDLLSTTQIGVGYTYYQAERVGAYFANLSYQGLYPILDLSFQRGNRNTTLYVDRVIPQDSLRTDRWQYNQLTAGVRLPLRLTQSKYTQNLNVSAYYNYLQVSGYDLPYRFVTEVGTAGSLNALTYGLSYSRLLRQSKRDVGPRWGQSLSATWRTTPFGGRLQAEQWGVQANVFFPGLGHHHSLRFRGGYQHQDRGTYRFSPAVFYPRGQAYVSDDRIVSGSAEYRLPLASPHWSLGRLLYVQRIKAAGFIDAAMGQSILDVRDIYGRLRGYETVNRRYQTTGLDISFVFNVLRLRTPLEVGVRTIYNLTTGEWIVQPLVIDIGF
ncbi:MAG: hypothetical protein JWP57_1423 [Spirosoma sp.]|nr:hypothetical protein [Spirosoma sp.]